MNAPMKARLAALALIGLPAALPAEKIDLERTDPVPAEQPIPVADFFRAPLIRDVSLNPSGTHVSGVVTAGIDHSALMIYDVTTEQIESIGTRGDSDIDAAYWLNDDHLAYDISVYKQGSFILCGARVGFLKNSYPILQNAGSVLIAVPPSDRMHPLLELFPNTSLTGRYAQAISVNASIDSGKLIDLANIDQKVLDQATEDNLKHVTQRHPVLETGDGFLQSYFANRAGELEFGITSIDGVLALHELDGERWQKCPEDLDEINVIGPGDNPGEVVVLGPRKDNKPRPLQVLKAATGEVLDVLAEDKAYDANGWLYRDPVSRKIVGVIYDRVGPHVTWLNDDYRALQKMVDGLFPGKVVRIIGNDEKGKMVLIQTSSDREPDFYHWVNLQTRKAGDIRKSRPWLDPRRMQPTSPIKFKTRDGQKLDAYVTMPAGASKKNPPPLIVLPPAGTWSRVVWGFDAEAQFFVSRGYAVLRPNHRGSAGTSWMFPTADEYAFRKMHEDVTEATKTLIASGLVDPNRVGIIGTGFGGFLALSGAAYEPSLYKCVAALAPTPDWGRLIADQRYNKFSGPFFGRMSRKLGDPDRDPEKWDAIAPLRHAGQIRAATFVSTGEFETSINTSGNKQIVSIVEGNHVPAESIYFVNDGGSPAKIEHRVELFTRLEAFLAKNLAGIGQ